MFAKPSTALFTIIAITAFSSAVHANGVSIDPVSWDYTASVCDCEAGVTVSDSSTNYSTNGLPASGNAVFPNGAFTDVVNGSSGVTITGFPAILVTAAVSQSTYDIPLGGAHAFGEMTYYFQLNANPGYGGSLLNIPVLFNGSSSQSITGTTGSDPVTTSVQMIISTADGNTTFYNLDAGYNGLYNGTLSLQAGVEYAVYMSATVDIGGVVGSAGGAASIDPMISIDPSVADNFDLDFSQGITNSAAAATPLPAALPLLASGLGGFGLLGWRKRRNARAA